MPFSLRQSWKILLALVLLVFSFLDTARPDEFAQLEAAAKHALEAQKAAANVVTAAKEALLIGNQELARLKSGLTQAQATAKDADKKLKPLQDALNKANDAKKKADEALAAAQKQFDASKKPEDQKKLDAAKKPAADATQKAAEAAAVLKKMQDEIDAAKKTVAEAPAAIKKQEQQVAMLSKLVADAEAALAAATQGAVEKQRAHQQALIEAGKLVSFANSIAPIFQNRCVACHNARTAKGRFNMEHYAGIMKGGESGAAVEAGDADASMVYLYVDDGSMPKDADPLSKEEIALIKKWVETGAVLDAGIAGDAPLMAIMPKPQQPEPPQAYRVPISITAIEYSPDGKLLATSGYHEIILWDAETGARVQRITNIAERVYDIEFSKDGKLLAVAAGTPAQIGEAKLIDPTNGNILADLVRTGDSVFSVAFSPDQTRLAISAADRSVRVFDVKTHQELLAVEDHADWVMDVAWSPDGTKLATASRDKTCKVFDVKTGDSLVTFNSHGQAVYTVDFAPDGKQVVSGGGDKQIRVWNVADGKQARAIGGFGGDVFGLTVTADGNVYSCSADKTVRLHQLANGKAVRTFSGQQDWVYSVTYAPATKRVAAGAYNGQVRVWNAADGKQLLEFTAAPGFESSAQK
jgi:hypothetical protein